MYKRILGLWLTLAFLFSSTAVFADNFQFSTTLRRGSKGPEVSHLQEFLKTMPDVYPEGLVTERFGALTEKAVKRFQAKYGMEQVGFIGPRTRAKLNSLILSPGQQSALLSYCPTEIATNCIPPPGGFPKLQTQNQGTGTEVQSKNPPNIVSISPSSSPVGVLVTITGAGFTPDGNDIHFDTGGTRNVSSINNGTALTFSVPGSVGGCYWGSGSSSVCTEPPKTVVPGGSYPISVMNANGLSNFVFFNIALNQNQSQNNLPPTQSSQPPPKSASNIPSCAAGKTDYFSLPPVALESINSVAPLGNLNPPGHVFPSDHIYFYTQKGSDQATSTALYSPGDVWVTSIRGVKSSAIAPNYTDYALGFSPCSEITNIFGHVLTLVPKLTNAFVPPFDKIDQYSAGGVASYNAYKNVEIHFSPGEVMGTANQPGALDFQTADRRMPKLIFANPSRWGNRQTFCSIDYFTNDVKNSLQNLLGAYDSRNLFSGSGSLKLTIEPLCGTFADDVPGTAAGNWILKGSPTYPEDPHLALVHDSVNPTYGVFSMGTGLASSGANIGSKYSMETGNSIIYPRIAAFIPLHSGEYNREFGEVKPDGKTYCYDLVPGFPAYFSPRSDLKPSLFLLLQLTSPTSLRVANLSNATSTCGSGPWKISDNFVDYER